MEKIDDIFFLYEKYGMSDYIGEDVSQIEHMIQAAMLAEKDGQPTFVIIAAFLHDIGHLVVLDTCGEKDNLGAKNHEHIAYQYLINQGIPENIAHLAKSHVVAKRYLVTKNKDYFDSLSDSSKETFIQQGGILSNEECKKLENDPLFNEIISIRKYDDGAKIKGLQINTLNYYKEMMISLLCSI